MQFTSPNMTKKQSETVSTSIDSTSDDIYTIIARRNRTPISSSTRTVPTNSSNKAVSLTPFLCRFTSIHIRVFHITWITFFICFFMWFSLTNLMSHIQQDLHLTESHKTIAIIIRSLSTIIFRLIFGILCDVIGPRYSYTVLLIISCISFLCISCLSSNPISYIIFSFFIGIIGASFVITQYHVTQFFSQSCVGIANGISAGWGNFGGGITQLISPLICELLIANNVSSNIAWRYTVLMPIFMLFIMIWVYYMYTTDTPNGNITNTRSCSTVCADFNVRQYESVVTDYRVWILALSYAVCFGIEITMLNYIVTYFQYEFGTNVEIGGLIALSFSLLNLFARALGGYLSDFLYVPFGIQGRVYCLFFVLLFESLFLCLFSVASFHFGYTVLMMIFSSFFVQMAEGVVFAIVPSFPDAKCHGLYMGIVGAGGNFGALVYTFVVFQNTPYIIDYKTAWIICSVSVFISAFTVLRIKFTQREMDHNALSMKSDKYAVFLHSVTSDINSDVQGKMEKAKNNVPNVPNVQVTNKSTVQANVGVVWD